jgi:hypothetical protein
MPQSSTDLQISTIVVAVHPFSFGGRREAAERIFGSTP